MRVFITGITGTLGTALTELHHGRGDQVFGCARNESKAVEWLKDHGRKATLFISPYSELCSNQSDLAHLLPTIDRLYHCAAMKHVDLCEENPGAAFQQNVYWSRILFFDLEQKKIPFVFVSSDKACLPQSVYGATKLLGERMAIRHGGAAVRLGNLIGSSGSVFQLWKKRMDEKQSIRLTDRRMTRFFVPVTDAAEFIADHHKFGSVSYPRNMKSVCMGDVAGHLGVHSRVEWEETGVRPGETLHQWIVAPGDRVVLKSKDAGVLCGSSEGYVYADGVHSNDRENWWNVEELLQAAGVK